MKKTLRFLLGAAMLAAGIGTASAAETCSQNFSSNPSRPDGELPACLAIDASTTTTTGATVNTFGYKLVSGQVWSAAGSVATVIFECRSYSTAPWYPCQSVSNPDATGTYYTLPKAYQYRVRISAYTSGTISAVLERYN